MPEIGDVRKGTEIGYKGYNKYIWSACENCGKQRWVDYKNGQPRYKLCPTCGLKFRGTMNYGKTNGSWKGGKRKAQGYILIWTDKANFFYPMADNRGYILEHRLIMAKHLKRCLLPWEIIHHRNSIKDDNRLENLELLPAPKYHVVEIITKAHLIRLQKRIMKLEAENILLKSKLKLHFRRGNK